MAIYFNDFLYLCRMFLKRYNLFYAIVILIVTGSCSGYEKLLKSSDYKLKYEKAFEYYYEEDYSKAMNLFEQLMPVYRGTQQADSVNFYHAMCNYKMGDYLLAGHHFKNFATIYGNSPFAEDAEFLHAYCHYKNSPRPTLDQESSFKAIEAFQLFMIQYPNSDRQDEAIKIIRELQNKLVEKSYLSARLYYDLGDYKASIIALNNSLIEYPDTKFREEIKYLILKSHFLLAENSVESKKRERFQETLDEYYSFVAEFPESEHIREVRKIYEQTALILNLNQQASN
jgi:outer membrane protein assembly factor BamD